jgi:hypothetical protein
MADDTTEIREFFLARIREVTDDDLLDRKQLAPVLGMSSAGLGAWMKSGRGPAVFRFGGIYRYRVSDVLDYVVAAHLRAGQPVVDEPEPA